MSASSTCRTPRVKTCFRPGFTLIELLVIIALTTLVLALLFKPLVDTYNLTSRAGTQVDAQVNARDVLRTVETALSNAVFVYDNRQTPINVWVPRRDGFGLPANQVNPYQVPYLIPFGMVEYVLPARQLDQRPGGTEIDPTTGNPIYGPAATPGQQGYALPLAPGRALGRIFIGLIDNRSVDDTHVISNHRDEARGNGMPLRTYGNPFEDRQLNSAQDNRYTLWRAEVLAYIPDPDDPNNPAPRYVPNLGLFHTIDPQTRQVVDTKNGLLQLHDPNFFYDNSLAGGDGNRKWAMPGWRDLNGDGRVQIWENWRAVSVSLLPTNRVDAIALEREEGSNAIIYYDIAGNPTNNAAGRPKVRPLISFTPTSVQNDLAAGGGTGSAGNEAPGSPPIVYRTQYTHWSRPFRLLVYRADPTNPTLDPLARNPRVIYMTDGSGKIGRAVLPPNAPLPDLSALPDVGLFNASGQINPNAEFGFSVDPLRGIVNFEIPSTLLLGGPARFSPAEVNASYFTTLPGSGVQVEKRYIDLRVLPQTTWNGVPLNPGLISPIAPTRPWFATVQIVPGSERVVGPDQNPGPNYGYPVLYRRVSANAGSIGKNEYKIHYRDVPNAGSADPDDPRVRIGFIEFNSLPDSPGQYNLLDAPDPTRDGERIAEDPAGQWGRVIYRPNGIPQLRVNRQTGRNEPVAPIEVTFSIQMNHPRDVVKVDYLTRELMDIALEVRLYEPRTSAPQAVALTSKVRVRNLMR
ncbi:MAG: hypothetical protein RMJ43_06560 [Chloroherpetonaceae bacterium]|nr:hypothetical protein [Chloroherpetonaceae bacterium]